MQLANENGRFLKHNNAVFVTEIEVRFRNRFHHDDRFLFLWRATTDRSFVLFLLIFLASWGNNPCFGSMFCD
jgi:hypothetical protein